MATDLEVRLLLVPWELGGVEVLKGKLNERFSGKRGDAETAR